MILFFSLENNLDKGLLRYKKYDDDFNFSLQAIPEYVDGGEAVDYIEREIISKLPQGISESKRIKMCKERIKEHFYLQGNKYPHWVQSAEWPIAHGKPARYIGNKKNGDLVIFKFEDVETKEIIEVEQCY